MDIQIKKLKVLEMLLRVNSEALMNEVEELLERKLIVGYATNGKSLTKADYEKRLEEAVADIHKGKTVSTDVLKNKYGIDE
jgi:hypothetical protein